MNEELKKAIERIVIEIIKHDWEKESKHSIRDVIEDYTIEILGEVSKIT